jgi:hypothetical protein
MAPAQSKGDHRQSVDWFTSRAVDAGVPRFDGLPSTAEVDEEVEAYHSPPPPAPVIAVPAIQVDEAPVNSSSDPMTDIDKSIGGFSISKTIGFW